jgi:flagellar hook-length control protein FliK
MDPIQAIPSTPGVESATQQPVGDAGGFAALFQQFVTGTVAVDESALPLSGEPQSKVNPLDMLSPKEIEAFKAILQSQGAIFPEFDKSDMQNQPSDDLMALMGQLQQLLQSPELAETPVNFEDWQSLSPQELDLALQQLSQKLTEMLGATAVEASGVVSDAQKLVEKIQKEIPQLPQSIFAQPQAENVLDAGVKTASGSFAEVASSGIQNTHTSAKTFDEFSQATEKDNAESLSKSDPNSVAQVTSNMPSPEGQAVAPVIASQIAGKSRESGLADKKEAQDPALVRDGKGSPEGDSKENIIVATVAENQARSDAGQEGNSKPQQEQKNSESQPPVGDVQKKDSQDPLSNHDLATKHSKSTVNSDPVAQASDSVKPAVNESVNKMAQVAEAPVGTDSSIKTGEPLKSPGEIAAAKATSSRMLENMDRHQTVRQVSHRIQIMVQNGESRTTLRLDPPSLGHVELEVTSRPGEIRIHMVVDDENVKKVMESSIQKLRDSLEQQNVKLDRMEVQVDSGRPENQNGDKDAANARRNFHNRHFGRGMTFADVTVDVPDVDTGRRLGYNTMEVIA